MARSRRPGQDGALGYRSSGTDPKEGSMAGRWRRITVTTACTGLVLPGAGLAAQAHTGRAASYVSASCSAGAHTLAPPGSHLYPDTGNGGYTSVHTLVHLVYDTAANEFLPGNSVVLTDRATQCLSSFSLDFERRSGNTNAGPDMTVRSVTGNGKAARYKFVITPVAPVPNGSVFTVTVHYTGRPGLHNDGDGTTEGWFRAPDGGFVTTEPVGSEDWMPLNDYPAAKPTYDFADTVTAGRVVVANGVLVSVRHHRASREFPGGSVTWRWHSAAPIASYLVEDSVGNYRLTARTASDGIRFYRAQDRAIGAARQKKNLAVMNKQRAITAFEAQFNGAYPFTSDGIVIGTPNASFEEEMQTMITFAGGTIDTDVLYHENMHQWWGDNVTESGYQMTFFKEGLATLAESLYHARLAEKAAGGPHTRRGRAAFQASLVRQFNAVYRQRGRFWTVAPSNPEPSGLFSGASTYARPGAAYIALRQILGHGNFVRALRQIQRRYGGGSITEAQLETGFARLLPTRSHACRARLNRLFGQWFDTAYPAGGGKHRPRITGPGLAGQDFYRPGAGCSRP